MEMRKIPFGVANPWPLQIREVASAQCSSQISVSFLLWHNFIYIDKDIVFVNNNIIK